MPPRVTKPVKTTSQVQVQMWKFCSDSSLLFYEPALLNACVSVGCQVSVIFLGAEAMGDWFTIPDPNTSDQCSQGRIACLSRFTHWWIVEFWLAGCGFLGPPVAPSRQTVVVENPPSIDANGKQVCMFLSSQWFLEEAQPMICEHFFALPLYKCCKSLPWMSPHLRKSNPPQFYATCVVSCVEHRYSVHERWLQQLHDSAVA